jgi:DNA-binding protein HU-beta
MNKDSLIAAVAEKTEVTKKDAEKGISAMLDAIAEALAGGGKIQIAGFGTFEVKDRPARKGHSPLTGKAIDIAASKAPVFKAGKALKDAVK